MNVVPRYAWGARPPREVNSLERLDTIVYHYSAADADEQADHANCAGRVKGIQRFHMDTRGWNDIAYNFLVCKHGWVFTGRGYHAKSAATGDDNSHTLAVCFLGDDSPSRSDVTEAGRDAFVDIARAIQARYGKRLAYAGHRDFMSTSCPGEEIYAFVHSPVFSASVNASNQLPGPSPKPRWFWTWGNWYLGGKKGPRPADAPIPIPSWAWAALDEWRKQHP